MTHLENGGPSSSRVLANEAQLLIVHGGKPNEAKNFVHEVLSTLVGINPAHGCQKNIELGDCAQLIALQQSCQGLIPASTLVLSLEHARDPACF